MRIKNNKFSPSDMNTILAGAGDYTEDGMEPIHQRHYNQHYNLEKYENDEFDKLKECLNKYGWDVEVTYHDDPDLVHCEFEPKSGQVVICKNVSDIADIQSALSALINSINRCD